MVGMWAGRSGRPWRSELGSQWDFVGELVGDWELESVYYHIMSVICPTIIFSFHPIPWGLPAEKVKQCLFFLSSLSFSLLCLTLSRSHNTRVLVKGF